MNYKTIDIFCHINTQKWEIFMNYMKANDQEINKKGIPTDTLKQIQDKKRQSMKEEKQMAYIC